MNMRKFLMNSKKHVDSQSPLISIIIPVYNVESYLVYSLESVQKQTYKNLQVILVDDGSTDKSSKICENFQKNDDRFELYKIDNGGQSRARNVALTKVRGEYVTFVDSDDILEATIVEKLLSLVLEYSSEMSMCYPSHFYDDSVPKFTELNDSGVKTKEDVLLDMFYQRNFIPSVWGKLFEFKLFSNNLKFQESIIFEDVEILPRLIERANKISYSRSELYGYRHREESTTTKKFSDKDLDIIYVCDLLEKKYGNLETNMNQAVTAYRTNCALRIWLTAPRISKYNEVIFKTANEIKSTGPLILKDKNARKKLKIAVILFTYFRPFIFFIHSHVNRWK